MRDLVEENARRGAEMPEYEMLDTGVFDGERYFDVQVEYAKATPDDILMRVTVENRCRGGGHAARAAANLGAQYVVLDAGTRRGLLAAPRPRSGRGRASHAAAAAAARAGRRELLFCENDTNTRRLYGSNEPGYFKDGINDRVAARQPRCGKPAARRHEMRGPGAG